MTGLLDFDSTYFGAESAAFFTGEAVSSLVPGVFPVAIGGHPYLLDLKSGDYQSGFAPRLRDQVFDGTNPDEQAIAVDGLWRAAKGSWHRGAGQVRADGAGFDPWRFHDSRNIDVWDRETIRILSDTAGDDLSQAVIGMAVANDTMFVALNTTTNQMKYNTNGTTPSYSDCTGEPASAPTGIATDGSDVYVSFGTNGVYRIDGASRAATQIVTGTVNGGVAFCRGRLLAFSGASVYDITGLSGPVALPAALYTHPSSKWVWKGFVAGANAIFGMGTGTSRASVFRFAMKPDGTGLDQPTVAVDLPIGEVGTGIWNAAVGLVLGLTNGVRYALEDGVSLTIGPRIATPGPVYAADAYDRFVWFGWQDGSSEYGLARLDVTQMVNDTLQPAYATDLMDNSPRGDVRAVVAEWKGKTWYGSGNYVQYETGGVNSTGGWLTSGVYAFGIPDDKVPVWFDLKYQPLPDGAVIVADLAVDDGSYSGIGSADIENSVGTTLRCPTTPGNRFEHRLTFTSSASFTAVLEWAQLRVYPTPRRGRLIAVPVILHAVIQVNGVDYALDVPAERAFLESLLTAGTITTYQEGSATVEVIVEDVQYKNRQQQDNPETFWNGTALVVLRTVEG